ncbi:GntR family transcriptional regulator [Luteimonas sp. BDR2-5]|uniref:GntR family transcriptional regulator n=1 Tax=Proluteimonas luteida TaxID=2878685 RepID=UPI001E2B3B71|nr:GntR family transcriptional regulator [Luteimonas sp. BDR2-5]MCD9028732.1 GntR family transcriptional regulator [Luteimonas sp. BDR2-5]
MHLQLSEATVRIREMILRGGLAPGQRVAEAPLAEQLGMSRTPVRQALPLLAQEGLLARHGTRGHVVRAFTAADVDDAIEVRSVLEGLAVRRVVERGASKACLRALRECLEDGDAIFARQHPVAADEGAYAQVNTRFHALIVEEAGGPMLTEALERVGRVPFAGPQALAFERGGLAQMHAMLHYAHRQHHAIVDAIDNGQGARAEALMREHAYAARESINMAGIARPVDTIEQRAASRRRRRHVPHREEDE